MKRIPASKMTKTYLNFIDENKYLLDMFDKLPLPCPHSNTHDVIDIMKTFIQHKEAARPNDGSLAITYSCELPAIPAMLRWSKSREVYDFNEYLAAELCEEDLPKQVPTAVFDHLPYEIFYIHMPTDMPSLNHSTEEHTWHHIDGFAVWRETNAENKEAIMFMAIFDPPYASKTMTGKTITVPYSVITFDLSFDTFADVVADSIARDEETFGIEHQRDNTKVYESMFAHLINPLLYVISKNADTKRVTKESVPLTTNERRTERKRRGAGTEGVTQVGSRIGPALGEYRTKSSASTHDASKYKTSPHMRRGHFHHFWTGKRYENHPGDKLIVRWVDPIAVNAHSKSIVEVHHTA